MYIKQLMRGDAARISRISSNNTKYRSCLASVVSSFTVTCDMKRTSPSRLRSWTENNKNVQVFNQSINQSINRSISQSMDGGVFCCPRTIDWLIDWVEMKRFEKNSFKILTGPWYCLIFPFKISISISFWRRRSAQVAWWERRKRITFENKFTEKTNTWRNFFFLFSLQQFPCKPPRNVECFHGPDWTPPNGVPILATWRDICPDDETADSVPPSGGWCCSCDTGCRLLVFRKTPRALPCEFTRKK